MKKHQLAAMVLSTLSAGLLISCSKPNENAQNTNKEQEVEVKDTSAQTSSTLNKTSSNEGTETNLQPIDIAPETVESYLNQVANSQIIPAYQQVVKQSRDLGALATKSCENQQTLTGEPLQALRTQWVALAKAWAEAEIVNFGPAMDSMSNLYINYYPDERGLVHQGVIDLIDSNPQLTAEQLASESAIVQGLPGLEEVLYANESLTPEQCRYVISASEALTNRLSKVQQAWENSPEELLGIDGDDNKAGLNRWINSVLSLVETTKSTSLDQPIGITGNKKGHLPADAAGQSRAIVNAKVAALNTALTDSKLVAILSEGGNDTLADEMSTLLAESSTLLAQLPEDLADASPEQQKVLYEKLTKLTQVIKRQLMPVLGVQVGFNSTDGD